MQEFPHLIFHTKLIIYHLESRQTRLRKSLAILEY